MLGLLRLEDRDFVHDAPGLVGAGGLVQEHAAERLVGADLHIAQLRHAGDQVQELEADHRGTIALAGGKVIYGGSAGESNLLLAFSVDGK